MFNYTEHICSYQSEQENQMEHGLKIQFIIQWAYNVYDYDTNLRIETEKLNLMSG